MKGTQQSQKTMDSELMDLMDLEDGFDFVEKSKYFIPFVDQN